MRSVVAFATVFASALAAPLVSWSPALGEFYAAVDRHIQVARQAGSINNPPTCDLSRAVQPVAPTPLPTPDPSWKLAEVVIGRGVQVSISSLAAEACTNQACRTIPAPKHLRMSSQKPSEPSHHFTTSHA